MPEIDPSQPKLRIAHLTTVDMSLALLLATELKVDVEAGHTVFGISAPGRYVPTVEQLGVTHMPIPALTRSWNLLGDARAFGQLVRTLKRLDLDVLHTHTPKAGVMGRIAGRLAGVPVVVNTCHGLWARPQDSLKKRLFVYGLEALAIRFSDFELFQNAQDARTLRRFLKKDRWRVVGNGVDLDRFQFDPEGRHRVRAELGVADDELLVGTIGRRVREKGLAEYAETAHRLRDQATFVWVGPEDDTDAAAHVPHQDAIRFVPERTDMAAVYSALDVFVLASYREGFSRASMEAAACGRPMVLTDIRGCREIGTHEQQLLLAEPHSADALAQQLSRLLDDADLRARLGRQAAERARASFDQRDVARTSLATYGRVAQTPANDMGASQPVTVLHVLPQDLDRGAQKFAAALRDALAGHPEQRHLVVTLFAGPETTLKAEVKLSLPRGKLAQWGLDPRVVPRLRRAIQDEGARVVVAHGGEALKYVVLASGPGVTTVYKRTGLSTAEVSRKSRLALYRCLSHRVSHIVGVSEALLSQSERLFDVPRARMTLIPNGRDPQRYRPLGPAEQPADPPLVLFVGQFEPGKRPALFLDVIEALSADGLEFAAAMAGDGPLLAGLEARAAELGVDLLGVRTDVPELLRRSALLVMTSAADTEGMPGVVIEAGLSGVPVVSTAAAGIADVVLDGQTGAVVTGDSVAELAARVAGLLADPGRRRDLGDAARARCVERFTLDATAGQWRSMVEGLTGLTGERAGSA